MKSSLTNTFLAVSLAIAVIVASQFVFIGLRGVSKSISEMTNAVRMQQFGSSYSSSPGPSTIPLSGDRFAVADGSSIKVYKVDASGRVHNLDSASTWGKNMVHYAPKSDISEEAYKAKQEAEREKYRQQTRQNQRGGYPIGTSTHTADGRR